jgi:hypothetical protein
LADRVHDAGIAVPTAPTPQKGANILSRNSFQVATTIGLIIIIIMKMQAGYQARPAAMEITTCVIIADKWWWIKATLSR